jgi:hypothetical protein
VKIFDDALTVMTDDLFYSAALVMEERPTSDSDPLACAAC